MQHSPVSYCIYKTYVPLLVMTFVLLVSLAICSCAAISLSCILIYHDINDKAIGHRWEGTLAVFFEILQICLSVTCAFAVIVALQYN